MRCEKETKNGIFLGGVINSASTLTDLMTRTSRKIVSFQLCSKNRARVDIYIYIYL